MDCSEQFADLFDEETPDAEEARRSYSIVRKAGPALEDQVRLADWHFQRMAEAEVRYQVLAAPIVEEVERLQARLKVLTTQRDQSVAWHEDQLIKWTLDCNLRDALGKTIPFAHGQIKTLATKGKTEVAEDVVLALYRDYPADYGDLIKPTVDSKMVRDRYELREDGTCVDTVTGEVAPEPVIVQTEAPGIKVAVTALGPGRDVAEE